MKRGFYTIMAAQFFSSLADNMLLIAAIKMLLLLEGPEWLTPLLKFFFTISYVVLAAFVGAFADSMPKGRVMFITNLVKIFGCLLIFYAADVHIPGIPAYWMVIFAYAVVGLGAAAYSPAKYGILTELLPPEQLVIANGWIEGLTVLSIVLGILLGGVLIAPEVSSKLLAIDFPFFDTGIDTAPEAAILVIAVAYLVAATFNLYIPDTGARYPSQQRNPMKLVVDFSHCFQVLWKDKLGQISLAVTTLFWGAGATLQFITLKWAESKLKMPLERGSILLGVSAVGITIGAVLAGRFVPLKRAISVTPYGIAMGFAVMAMCVIDWMPAVYLMLMIVGGLAGYFVVPMNALLQHRGHVLLSAGHSIAVQNFNENVSILVMLALYALMIRLNLSIDIIIILFGLFVSSTMFMVMRWNAANHRADPDLDRHIGEAKH
ncbi:lysophospholipid transporter LplT [Usitatibacter palustris]|uniref:Lysophospholipid transporter LplT n=1 Tax=Usitatibacter palustris TaxID=2732487 RepID=A0A6M4H771_9PROT|nr:lysophospholipid transporter LplT [Usitatibacter palustris]QJR15025.1 Lysophospholipid transporter LplT [Usitatibacter palustris]